jgi:hypothetical protein
MDWETNLIKVSDGGNDFFEITINLDKETIIYFYIHGYA